MKKIIEGKMYNTETATYIGRYRTDEISVILKRSYTRRERKSFSSAVKVVQ